MFLAAAVVEAEAKLSIQRSYASEMAWSEMAIWRSESSSRIAVTMEMFLRVEGEIGFISR